MVGYLKVVDVKDIKYHAVHLNHLFKDDFLYISYNKEIKKQKDRLGFDDYYNYDICICGNDILKVLFEIEKYSKIDNYVEYNRNAIKEMYLQKGTLKFDNNGIAKKGILIRHLVLPMRGNKI